MSHGTAADYNGGCRCESCRAGRAYAARATRARNAERIKEDPSLAPHGTVSTYTNWRCRCGECRDAWAAYIFDRKRKRIAERAVTAEMHGHLSTYLNYACRCDACRAAMAEYGRDYRARNFRKKAS